MTEQEISILNLEKAQLIFEQFRTDMINDRDKAGAIQAFEFCYELSWKTMKHFLEKRGLEVGSPKDTFRKAALEKLIPNPEVWFDFQKYRNLTVHTYNKRNLDEIVGIFDQFSQELNQFIVTIREFE